MAVHLATSDAAILGQLIGLHYADEPVMLDTTWGGGRMWKGCRYQPSTRFDARPLPGVDVVGRWDQLPDLFPSRSFEALVWDPPHQTDGGEHALGSDWTDAYGTAGASVRGYPNITHLYSRADFGLGWMAAMVRIRQWSYFTPETRGRLDRTVVAAP